jgi:hypothetical protein
MLGSSCSLIPSKKVEVITKPIERQIVQPILPREIDLKEPYWYVVSEKNIDELKEVVVYYRKVTTSVKVEED